MPTQNINLTERQASFIRDSVAEGYYRDADDVVGAALRLLEQQESENRQKLEHLREIVASSKEAFARGEYTTYTHDTLHALFEDIDSEIRADRAEG